MAIYAIGDIQGCFEPLRALLRKIDFQPDNDTLWFAGDLVNRGPDSLKSLRYVKSLGRSAVTVLGNHDIHLMALYYGLRSRDKDPTLEQVLDAPDIDELINWLQQQPILHVQDNFVLVHAGLHPHWSMDTAVQLADELHHHISQIHDKSTLASLYGPTDGSWQEAENTDLRLRYAVNCFTRMRFCNEQGELDFKHSNAPGEQPAHLMPWFTLKDRQTKSEDIIFGHWAALGVHQQPGIYALDSGCVWGNSLTALRLDDLTYFSVSC